MSTKATPGPWVIEPAIVDGVTLYWYVEQKLPVGATYRGSVCTVSHAEHIGGITREEAFANATLIAAARPMLEACKALHKLLDRDACVSGSDIVLPCESHDQAFNYLHEARALLK